MLRYSAKAPGRLTPDPLGVGAEVAAAGQAVAAVAADDVSLAADEIADGIPADVGAHAGDASDELVSDLHRHGNRPLRPCVPLVDVDVGAADGSALNLDENVVGSDLGFRDVHQPQPGRRLFFYECFHIPVL
jgi:hypothetical protein